jgi:hypothetical protein
VSLRAFVFFRLATLLMNTKEVYHLPNDLSSLGRGE